MIYTGSQKLAIYPGSFDPFTKAHESVVMQARCLYDKVIILVTDNPNKHYMFTKEQRVAMIQKLIDHAKWQDVVVDSWDGLVVTFAKDFINYYDMINVVRGLRAGNGQEEFDLAKIYYDDFSKLDSVSSLRTVFFPVLDDQLQAISSTRVREYIRVGAMDYVHRYCPVAICESINNIIRETYVTKQ